MIQLYPIGSTAAIEYAAGFLKKRNLDIVDHPTPEVTHLLLDIPSFGPEGLLRSGSALEPILRTLPQRITVIGGNLTTPALDAYRKWDFLSEEAYLAQNAAITAACALQVAMPLLPTTISDSPALILGWGRIGKCLAKLLRGMGCDVTIAVRKDSDLAMLQALGYRGIHFSQLHCLSGYRIIFNTVPHIVLSEAQLAECKNCVKIDLASQKGIPGEDVVWARGLPGIHAPESSGKLIADTILYKLREDRK